MLLTNAQSVNDLWGTIPDWVDIFATIITIILSVKFFTDESKVNLKFIGQVAAKEYEMACGAVSYGAENFLHISIYNYSKVPARVRIEGFRNKPSVFIRVIERFTFRYNSTPFTYEGTFLDPIYKFHEIEPLGYRKLDPISLKYTKEHARINGLDTSKPIEFIIREIRGKVIKFTIRIKD